MPKINHRAAATLITATTLAITACNSTKQTNIVAELLSLSEGYSSGVINEIEFNERKLALLSIEADDTPSDALTPDGRPIDPPEESLATSNPELALTFTSWTATTSVEADIKAGPGAQESQFNKLVSRAKELCASPEDEEYVISIMEIVENKFLNMLRPEKIKEIMHDSERVVSARDRADVITNLFQKRAFYWDFCRRSAEICLEALDSQAPFDGGISSVKSSYLWIHDTFPDTPAGKTAKQRVEGL